MGTRHLIRRRALALIALVGCLVLLTGCATLFAGSGSLRSGLDAPAKRAYFTIVFRCIPTSPTKCDTGLALGDLSDEGSNATFPGGVHLKFHGIMKASNNPGDLDNCMSATLNYTVTPAVGALSDPSQLLGGGQAEGGTVAVTACAKSGPLSANTAEITVLTGPYQGYSVSGPVEGNFTAARP